MGYLSATWAQVFTRTRSGRVIQRYYSRNPRWETGLGSANDVTHRKRARRISENLRKVSGAEFLPRKKKVDYRLLAEALGQVSQVVWADRKVVIERLCLSLPHVEKPFNSKVIKSFVPELRSRKVFRVSGFLCYLCALWTLWTFCVPVWICLFHVFISGYVHFTHIRIMGM